MFRWLERLVDPYPTKNLNQPLPTKFFPFVWQAAYGVRRYLLILVLCTAGAASFEALLYSKIGELVNWLSKSQPDTFLEQHTSNLTLLSIVLLANIFFASAQSLIKHQILYSNFPMRLRWRFHNLLMKQSLDFSTMILPDDYRPKLCKPLWQYANSGSFWVTCWLMC